jgi:hypothetical protein
MATPLKRRTQMNHNIFQDFDFSILDSKDFKEDSVREEIILPILKKLGYSAFGENKIIRSKSLPHPFVKIGSTKRSITLIPDYLLQVEDNYKWVLDAKAPNEKIEGSRQKSSRFRTELILPCNNFTPFIGKNLQGLQNLESFVPKLRQALAEVIYLQILKQIGDSNWDGENQVIWGQKVLPFLFRLEKKFFKNSKLS